MQKRLYLLVGGVVGATALPLLLMAIAGLLRRLTHITTMFGRTITQSNVDDRPFSMALLIPLLVLVGLAMGVAIGMMLYTRRNKPQRYLDANEVPK